MKGLKRAFVWYILFTKRLLKKPVFIIILAFVPLLVVMLNIVSQQDSGIVSVALVQENTNDSISSEIVNELLSEDSLIRFTSCKNAELAKAMLSEGKVDSVWVFTDKTQEEGASSISNPTDNVPFVNIIERENNIALSLVHEKLYGTLFKYCSESLYIDFIRENVPELNNLSDEQLMQYYDGVHTDTSLFDYSYINSNKSANITNEQNYLVTPIRGMLSVLIIFSGLAAAMYYMKDVSRGVFSQLTLRAKPLVASLYHFTSIVLVSIASLISLFMIGVAVSPLRELVMSLLYALCCTVFCMNIRLLCVNLKILSVMTPVIIIALIAICPVFFDLDVLRFVQIFLPPFYYIKSAYRDDCLLYMLFYFVANTCAYLLLRKATKKS